MLIYKTLIKLRGDISPDIIHNLVQKHSAGRGRPGAPKYYLTGVGPEGLTVCQIADQDTDAEAEMEEYLCRLGVPYRSIRRDQICISDLANNLNRGNDVELCPPVPDVLGPLHMMPYICEPFSSGIQEATFEKLPKTRVKKFAARQHSRAFTEELDRIWEGEGRPFRGHPVLYSMVCDSRKKNENLTEFLLPVLHGAGRLPANRVCHLAPYQHPLPEFILKDLYRAQGGACIVVDLHSEPSESETRTMLQALARLAREYRSKVLTVFRACTDDEEALSALKELTRGLPILKLTEDRLSRTEAKRMLKDLADKAEMTGVSFADKLPAEQTSFCETELRALFNKWQDEYLLTETYPQYAGVQLEDTAEEKTKAPQTSAYEELQKLIGLKEAKRIIAQAVNYTAMQKLCRERGLPAEPPHLHMVFTGNPGTAKTTVARLVARIFREYGVLAKGELVEVGRGDLIGKYVGWTANLVKEKFREAEGSVLFIDEAYSLLDDRENEFGDEAINAIVQEMENRRDSTVVIFAGYREPMRKFLERNAGLRSRVSYQIDFPDYSEEEMMEVTRLILAEKYRELAPGAELKVRQLICADMGSSSFGNGRHARLLVERAMMAQATRLASLPPEKITTEDLLQLKAEDFLQEDTRKSSAQPRPIGFCA